MNTCLIIVGVILLALLIGKLTKKVIRFVLYALASVLIAEYASGFIIEKWPLLTKLIKFDFTSVLIVAVFILIMMLRCVVKQVFKIK